MAHPYKLAQRESAPKVSKASKSAKPAARNVKAFVSWSDSEKREIARRSLELMAENHPTLARVDAVRAAVEELPASRRKPIKDMAHTSWILPLWDELAAEADAKAAAAPEAPPSMSVSDEAPEAAKGPEIEPAAPQTRLDKRRAAAVLARAAIAAKMAAGEYRVVKWKDAERLALAKAFRQVQAANPKLKETAALRVAIAEALPADRQRKITGYVDVKPWMDPLLVKVDAELAAEAQAEAARLEEQRAQKAADKLAAQQAKEAEEQERNEREMRGQRERLETEERARVEAEASEAQARNMAAMAYPPAEFAPVSPVPVPVPDSLTLEELLSLGARRLARAVLPPIFDEFRAELHALKAEFVRELGLMSRPGIAPSVTHAPRHSPVMESPAPAPRKPRVYVLGGRPEWHSDIERTFSSKLDFTFNAGSNEGGRRDMGAATNADLVIVCSDAVPHTDVAALQKVRAGFERVDGGTSSVKRRLSLYLTERGKAAAH